MHFLEAEDVLETRLAKVTLLHLQNGISLFGTPLQARREATYIKKKE